MSSSEEIIKEAENPVAETVPQIGQGGRAVVLGLGGAGVKIIDAVKSQKSASWLLTAAIDTDSSVISASLADVKLAASADWMLRDGAGCGGDMIRGERAIANERKRIGEIISGAGLLVVVCGLGGGTGTGGIRTIASIARELGVPAVFMLATPFAFEPFSARKNADKCIAELLPLADIILEIPNDLLFSVLPPSTPAEKAFAEASREMALTSSGLARMLRCRNVLGSDYATFMNALKGKRASCSVGIGYASSSDGLDRCAIALERMLASPFLGGKERLEKSDAVMVILSAGPDLELAEMKHTMEMVSKVIPQEVISVFGVNSDELSPGVIQLTAISVKYAEQSENKTVAGKLKKPVVPASKEKKPASEETGDLFEPELGLPSFSKGIFDKYPSVRIDDVDTDIPTFQRRGVFIDEGK